MADRNITIQIPERQSVYEITIAHGSLSEIGPWTRNCVANTARVLVISNPTVFGLYGDEAVSRLRTAGFETAVWLMDDGEQYKSFDSVQKALGACEKFGMSRSDAIIALGGGVVGDLAGFTASIYLRGITFLQVPTTLLSMIDSSVGGKTGVNSAAGKNRIGTFYQPGGVLIDASVLRTLDVREVTAGLCEAIKHGILAGGDLFAMVSGFLAQFPVGGLSGHFESTDFQNALDGFVEAQLAFKASIVSSDERESAGRTDAHSRKILNFGHTLAHALENVTAYEYFKHGEAVGYGILYAAELSKLLALIDEDVVNLLYDVVHRAGVLPPIAHIAPDEILEAFRFDKKIIGGSLQLILIDGIGQPHIVDVADVPQTFLRQALNHLRERT